MDAKEKEASFECLPSRKCSFLKTWPTATLVAVPDDTGALSSLLHAMVSIRGSGFLLGDSAQGHYI